MLLCPVLLQECSRTPAEAEREDALKRQLELKARQAEVGGEGGEEGRILGGVDCGQTGAQPGRVLLIPHPWYTALAHPPLCSATLLCVPQNLEHSLGVLRSKLDTDSKTFRHNLSAAAREKDALKRQLATVQRNLEDREKEVRGRAGQGRAG